MQDEDYENREEKDFFGLDFQNYIDKEPFNANPSMGTGKNETGTNTPGNNSMFDKIDELNNYHPQTELKKDGIKIKEKYKLKHKNSIAVNSSNDLSKTLQKKKARGDAPTKKRKKTKSEMDFTLKTRTEINPEIKKKERDKKFYEMFNQEHYYDVYDDDAPNDDMLNMMNDDDPNAEVNKIQPEYKSQMNSSIPESLDMVISTNK